MSMVRMATTLRDRLQMGWCQGALARSETGRRVRSYSPRAVEWCWIGAWYGALKVPHTERQQDALEEIVNQMIGGLWDDWNDDPERTRAEVLQAADRVVAKAREIEEAG